MKFPKSLHAEGWDRHFPDNAQPGAAKPSRYVHPDDALHMAGPGAADEVPLASRRVPQARAASWVIGLGATAAMAAFAISTFNHQAAPEEAALASQGVVQPEHVPETVVAQNDAATPAPEAPLEPDSLPATAAGVSSPSAPPVIAARAEAPAPEKVQAQKPAADRPLPDKPGATRAEPRPEPVLARLAEPEVPPPPPLQAAQLTPAQAAPEASAPEVDDPGISLQVRQALAADPVLGQASIQVSTQQGQVRLEGEVPDAASKSRATWLASGPVGVRAVDNRLVVPGAVVSMSAAMPLESLR
ncbi:MAG: hypothetical protein DI603_03170 [Roseateles depolymerans]|uniref:BON domain-containing protein n=1 Tax=Roseateles depolymerans TaxID=76731 RepID=A0A2W5G1G0_9BURK|nr:MAG: hypothetical protein DI603_03170 [Roseateles depolymerans]